MNWWLMAYHLKHGMMTVRPAGVAAGAHGHSAQAGMDGAPYAEPRKPMGFLALAPGEAIAFPSSRL
jgi:hypothetical protein